MRRKPKKSRSRHPYFRAGANSLDAVPKMCERWQILNNAFGYIQDHINQKEERGERYRVNIYDLLLVKNFKVTRQAISTPLPELPAKLPFYSDVLQRIADDFEFTQLQDLHDAQLEGLIELCDELVALTENGAPSKISGIGPAIAAALGAAHFPSLIPVLDKNALAAANLCGAEIPVQVRGQYNDVVGLESHFGDLIRFCRDAMLEVPETLQEYAPFEHLRDLDRTMFCLGGGYV